MSFFDFIIHFWTFASIIFVATFTGLRGQGIQNSLSGDRFGFLLSADVID